jgi:hypothetical protein
MRMRPTAGRHWAWAAWQASGSRGMSTAWFAVASGRRVGCRLLVAACIAWAVAGGDAVAAGGRRHSGPRSPASTGTPQNQAPYQPGASPYTAGIRQRPRYFVPPTNPRTPTWKMYGTPPGVVPGDWPSYAPLGFGGYRFPAVGAQAYR